MIVIGVDPGLTGALALLDSERGLLDVQDVPTCPNGTASGSMRRWVDAEELRGILASWSLRWEFAREHVEAAIERPIPMPSLPAQTIAAQFDTLGVLRASLQARQIAPVMVEPRVWKTRYGLARDKEASREVAVRLHAGAAPWVRRKRDHNRAEAILIGDWLVQERVGHRRAA